MTVADLLADLRQRGVLLWRDGDRLHVDTPAGLATADMRKELARNKGAVLGQLDREVAALPISEARVLARTRAGVEVLEVVRCASCNIDEQHKVKGG